MTKTETTHTGTCQACGRRQAIHIYGGMIAKHGYTTDYGFFNGVCGGSDHLPLELDTALNIATVAAMLKFAANKAAEAEAEITNVEMQTGSHLVRGRREAIMTVVDRAEFATLNHTYTTFDAQVDLVRLRLRRIAEVVRADAATLDALRDRVHGQPLQERLAKPAIKREHVKTYREAYARVEALKALGHKAQSRRSYGGYDITYR
jgi:hypothetical protein